MSHSKQTFMPFCFLLFWTKLVHFSLKLICILSSPTAIYSQPRLLQRSSHDSRWTNHGTLYSYSPGGMVRAHIIPIWLLWMLLRWNKVLAIDNSVLISLSCQTGIEALSSFFGLVAMLRKCWPTLNKFSYLQTNKIIPRSNVCPSRELVSGAKLHRKRNRKYKIYEKQVTSIRKL